MRLKIFLFISFVLIFFLVFQQAYSGTYIYNDNSTANYLGEEKKNQKKKENLEQKSNKRPIGVPLKINKNSKYKNVKK